MADPVVAHLVVGPEEHGVVRHGLHVARTAGHRIIRAADVSSARDQDLTGVDVVHLPFADGLLGADCSAAAKVVEELADELDARGIALSVTVHDVPVGNDGRAERRRAAYERVLRRARGVVVNSVTELAAVEPFAAEVHALSCIPLPVDAARTPLHGGAGRAAEVAVLGFVWAGRGHDEVLAALPPGCGMVALGGVAAGHDRVAAELAAAATLRGVPWTHTGYLADADLPSRLAGAGVPVAPNRHATASASIATWLAHGRRPLVPTTDYTRELAARMPGALWLYDGTAELTELISAALRDPGRTRVAPQVPLGPSSELVAERYRRHLVACTPQRLLVRTGGNALVPGNRWDLLPPDREPLPPVSVVVPYYGLGDDAQPDLDRVLTGLRRQTIADRLEIVVADDGSPCAPSVAAAGEVPVRVVRQRHDGFGAGRARNLGAAAARHDLLAFLDADTVPEPGYLEALMRLPSTDATALVVGRRRHVDLSGLSTEDMQRWLAGHGPGPAELPEPGWLRDAYRDTADLLHADSRSYRFVISAVLGMHRTLFEGLRGFDARFRSYGGEDWELAHRAWQAGALFAHVPAAVAWHHGADWGARDALDRQAVKDAETATLARLLPDPVARGPGQWLPYPHLVVTMPADTAAGVLATARSAFACGVDCGLWLTGERAAEVARGLGDPRIRPGPPPEDVLARSVVQLDLDQPCDLGAAAELATLADRVGLVRSAVATARSSRALGRCRSIDQDARDETIAQLFGVHDSTAAPALPDTRLDDLLGRIGQPTASRS